MKEKSYRQELYPPHITFTHFAAYCTNAFVKRIMKLSYITVTQESHVRQRNTLTHDTPPITTITPPQQLDYENCSNRFVFPRSVPLIEIHSLVPTTTTIQIPSINLPGQTDSFQF